MPSVVVLSGSPSPTSRTAAVLDHLAPRLRQQGHSVQTVRLRGLPAGPLLAGDATHSEIAPAVEAISAADGVVVGSPIYKAAFSGLLKVFLDLLPQFALAGKTVLPLVTGGSTAHVLALDYALRPVLTSMWPAHVVQGYFLPEQSITVTEGGVLIDPQSEKALLSAVDTFSAALRDSAHLVRTTP